ncbi:MAG: rhomboid family intramembrane serine protease [Bacteriovoracaceae bacterium]|nr:rhomboid family intramembrane serine protease [Bacteriovoracaceae bacterium]
MELETKIVENYLTKKKYNYGILSSVAFLLTSLILSHLYWRHDLGFRELLLASPVRVHDNSEYWRLFSSAMIHADLSHFLSNSLFLSIMGYFVASSYGWIAFPIVTFLMGGITNFIVINSSIQDIGILGASGMVYWLWGFWLILYFCIERQVSINRRFMKIFAVSLMVLVPTSYDPNTSYYAHGIGLLLGVLTGFTHFLFNKNYFRSFERREIIIPEIDDYPEDDFDDNPPLYYQ